MGESSEQKKIYDFVRSRVADDVEIVGAGYALIHGHVSLEPLGLYGSYVIIADRQGKKYAFPCPFDAGWDCVEQERVAA